MEKKNTILLTVIAIATLLVAVVGATFAYFTATVNVDENTKDQNTTNVTTQTMVSATMEFGNKVTATNVLPGYKAVRSVTIKGDGEEGDLPVNAIIKVQPTIPTVFGEDVTWSLYKSATAITCASNNQTTTGEYSDAATCTIPEGLDPVLTGSTSEGTLPVAVEYNTDDTYYLVVEYANNGVQNAQQGQTFEVVLDFVSA